MKPKTVFYLSLVIGILILAKAIYDATNPEVPHNTFSTLWDFVMGALLLSVAYRNYKKMKTEEL